MLLSNNFSIVSDFRKEALTKLTLGPSAKTPSRVKTSGHIIRQNTERSNRGAALNRIMRGVLRAGLESDTDIEAIKAIPVLERATFGEINRVFSEDDLTTLLKQYQQSVISLMCKSRICRPCMGFRKKYERLAKANGDVLFLEIFGDDDSHTRQMMMDFKVKATPTFRIYVREECVAISVGVNEDKFLEAINHARNKLQT